MFQRLREFMTGLVPPYEDRDYMTRHAEIEAARQRLRDEFAMAILSGAAAGLNTIHDAEQFAKNVYLMADFMMLAREAE